jgi:hypothetical protein
MEVNLKKLLQRYSFSICALLFVIVIIAGCTEIKTTSASPSPGLVTVIITPPTNTPDVSITHIGHVPTLSYAYANEKCPIPPLVFNNSQNITKLQKVLIVENPGQNASSNAYPIPSGSIIYRSSGSITRIFDPDGKQILVVNDSISPILTRSGYTAATTLIIFPENTTVIGAGNNFQYLINENDSTHPCVSIEINDGWTNPFVPSHIVQVLEMEGQNCSAADSGGYEIICK